MHAYYAFGARVVGARYAANKTGDVCMFLTARNKKALHIHFNTDFAPREKEREREREK